MNTTVTLEPKKVAGSIEHENIKMRCKEERPTVKVGVRKNRPLSKHEIASQISVTANDFQFVINMDSIDIDVLEGGIHDAQERLMKFD